MDVTHQPMDPGPAAWNMLLPSRTPAASAQGRITADFVVIGAGFAGLAAARRLHQLEPKASIVLLEARTVAEGPAGRNSGFMIDLPHNLASKDYAGQMPKDREQTAANREAIAFAADAAQELGMTAEAFTLSGKINAAATAKGDKHNSDYAEHLRRMGEPYEWLDEKAMQQKCGTGYYRSGLFTPGTAMIQPALYVRNLADGLVRDGVTLHENSPVKAYHAKSGAWEIETPEATISAGKIILATNGHAESFGLFRRRLMHVYLYASMTAPLSDQQLKAIGGEEVWGLTPADPMGTTVRRISGTGGTRIIIRNGITWSPERSASESAVNDLAAQHGRSLAQRFPALADTSMQYRWGGLLCLSMNTVPAFGEKQPGLFSACCQNGLGTAMGTLSGKLAAELALGYSSQTLDAFMSASPPSLLPPGPIAKVGAKARFWWGQRLAGGEL